MSDQPEALRLADRLEGRWALHPEMQEAAAELRRLHAENEALQNTKHYEAPRGFVLNPDYLVPELQAERDALRQRLALAEAVASAASAWDVANKAEVDDWDEREALEAALKPWRAQRAIDAAKEDK